MWLALSRLRRDRIVLLLVMDIFSFWISQPSVPSRMYNLEQLEETEIEVIDPQG